MQIDSSGKPKKFTLTHKTSDVGRKSYVIEILPPKAGKGEKDMGNPRLERAIDVVDTKLIRILYIEGTPRYEFRFLKSLIEREQNDQNQKKHMEIKVLLYEGDKDFFRQDLTALETFPTRKELDEFDVVILGDVDPQKLGQRNMQMLADYTKGLQEGRTGAGLVMIAGPNYAPHAYAGTPIASILPIDLVKAPPPDKEWPDSFQIKLTPFGRQHQMFQFSDDIAENQAILSRLKPLYFYAEGYRRKEFADVLAVHPTVPGDGPEGRHPLILQHLVGHGKVMFIGVEETWRWRFREDEGRYNTYWIQSMRAISRSRITRTVLRLDRQTTAYRQGEPISVTVQFPEHYAGDGKLGPDVKVMVEYTPKTEDGQKADVEIQPMIIKKSPETNNLYEDKYTRTRQGKYRFWLASPDVSAEDPNGQKPEADATVELPPGELDRTRMNQQEMEQAAAATDGKFYTLLTADNLLEDLPPGFRVTLATPRDPDRLWNQWYALALIVFLLTSEWLLRKRKHLL
jgi:hypothetical protein